MPYFIAVEGSEAGGKSKQIHSLAEKLFGHSKYHHLLLTREPFKKREIRSILEQDSNPYSQAEKLADLFIQDRIEHLNAFILPNMVRGISVISDRYKYSTIVYQSCQGLSLDYLVKRHDGFLVPDLTIILDVPVKVSRKRLKKRKDKKKEKKFEDSDKFLQQLRERYLEMPNILKDENIVIINGNRSPRKVSEDIWDCVKKIV